MASINIFNIPASVPFLPTLAEGLKATYGEHLKDALVFLPTRRAARQLGDLLADEGRVRFLPRLRTLADLDPDEPPFEPGFLADLVSPAMPAMQRRFQLSQLVKRYYENSTGETLNPAGALSLTDPLLAILDDAALEQVDQADLSILAGIEKFVAGNFQNAAEFYRILQDFWPGYVSGENLMEPMARRVALLDALTDLWLDRPPDYPVIIAGSTGTLKATARLMRCVAHQKKGLVLLPALDRHLKASVWETIEDDHPQNSLKCLLQTMELSNMDVQNWMPHVPVISPARRRVISESLVPVSATGDWIERIDILRENYQQDGRGGDIFDDATRGLSLIETRTEDEEALTVALILRETLETDVQTAAFVTPDPALARRVRTRLARWGVTVEYSQGEPLEETRIGGFLTGILKLAQRPHSPVDLAYLLAHPLTALRREPGDIRAEWRALEKKKFREQRPAPGLLKENSLLVQVHHILTHLDVDKDVSPTLWARALAKVAESFAVTRDESGAVRLWTGEDGLQTAGLMENIIAHGDILGPVSLAGFSDLFSCLMRGSVVRPRANIHPRLQILGPLEARMVVADRIVLGGLNEGTWPSSPPHMPFLSRGMRRAIGLSLPERRYGLAAHDFSSLACYPDVIMTRSERSSEGPRVASRWIWRLKTLLRGALGERVAKARLAPPKPYLAWARAMDAVASHDVKPAEPPNPSPPVDKRWPQGRQISVTQVRTWIRDPYSIYARYILGLKKLGALYEPVGPREYGTAIHDALKIFFETHKTDMPKTASRQLQDLMADMLRENGFEDHDFAPENIRLECIAHDLVALFKSRRESGWIFALAEAKGQLDIPDVRFTLIGKPDLIEVRDGNYAAIDYKTGAPPTVNEVKAGFDLQMPLLAWMLGQGAFKESDALDTGQLLYIRVKGGREGVSQRYLTKPDARNGLDALQYVSGAQKIIKNLISEFDSSETTYPSQPRAKYVNDYGDYDDLARRREWQQLRDDDGSVS